MNFWSSRRGATLLRDVSPDLADFLGGSGSRSLGSETRVAVAQSAEEIFLDKGEKVKTEVGRERYASPTK